MERRVKNLIEKLKIFTAKMKRDRVRAHASEAAFFIIMSFFPVIMLLLGIIQFTPLKQEQLLLTLENVTPFEVSGILNQVVTAVYDHSGSLVPWTVLIALWSGGKSMMGLADGLNSIYQIEETKNYIVTRIRAAVHTVFMLFALILSLGILVFGYWFMELLKTYIPLLKGVSDALVLLPMGIAMLLLMVLFLIMYTFLPNRRQRMADQIPGAIFSSVAWSVFSYAFSIYLEYSVNMSVIYGSLTTLVVVMLWLYICMYLLFIGAEINQYFSCKKGLTEYERKL